MGNSHGGGGTPTERAENSHRGGEFGRGFFEHGKMEYPRKESFFIFGKIEKYRMCPASSGHGLGGHERPISSHGRPKGGRGQACFTLFSSLKCMPVKMT